MVQFEFSNVHGVGTIPKYNSIMKFCSVFEEIQNILKPFTGGQKLLFML